MGNGVLSRRAALAGLALTPASALLAQGDRFAGAMDAARAAGQLNALVIAQNGLVLSADNLRGPALDVPVNVKSVSKSILSALIGIAIAKRALPGLDMRVAPVLAREVPRRADPRVKQITLRHMLAMQSGLQEVSGAAYGAWVDTRFWIYDALSKPIVADPGTEMLYSTASYHVLGAVLAEATGIDLHSLADAWLAVPMGITLPPWTQDPQGRYLGGNDMRISPLDMLKFGEMYRRGGLSGDTRILTEDWIADSWAPTGNSKETGHGYGFGWFIWDLPETPVFYARGYGGQMIFVVPDRALTVVMTSNPGRPAPLSGHLGVLFDIFRGHILPQT